MLFVCWDLYCGDERGEAEYGRGDYDLDSLVACSVR